MWADTCVSGAARLPGMKTGRNAQDPNEKVMGQCKGTCQSVILGAYFRLEGRVATNVQRVLCESGYVERIGATTLLETLATLRTGSPLGKDVDVQYIPLTLLAVPWLRERDARGVQVKGRAKAWPRPGAGLV